MANLLLKRKITKAFKKEQHEILESLNKICCYLKKIHQYYLSITTESTFTPSFCNTIICDQLVINNNFEVKIK
jgi:hypothetical protein